MENRSRHKGRIPVGDPLIQLILDSGLLGKPREHPSGGVQLQVAEIGFHLFVEAAHADTPPLLSASIVTE